MSPVMVIMNGIKSKDVLASILVCATVVFCVTAKPANVQSSLPSAASPVFRQSQPIYSPRSSGRKVLQSWNDDGSWQASARLPTSSQNGGNGRSRYKIRRDGSLSLALQNPKHTLVPSRNKFRQGSSIGHSKHPSTLPSWAARSSRNDPLLNRNKEVRHFSPAELRSFSVVISDVDVTGDYNSPNNNLNEQDAYAKAGVSSYHLKSNSIHRMNGSWKMKPGNGSPTSSDLLNFLSHFANGDGRAIRSENVATKQKRPLRKILGQEKVGKMESDEIPENHNDADENQQPFKTWQESSRNIPVSSVSQEASPENISSTATVADSSIFVQKGPQEISTTKMPQLAIEMMNIDESTMDNTADIENGSTNVNNGSKPMNETKVVLHELISTLEELNKNFEKEETENKPPSKVDIVEKSRVNQTEEGTEMAIHETGNDEHDDDEKMTLYQFKQETELDQTSSTTASTTTAKSENKEQMQVDVEMSKSLMPDQNNGREKEGDVFVQNDTAKFSGISNNSNDAGIAHNSSSSIAEYHHNEDDGALDGGGEEMRRKKRRTAKSAFFESTKSTNSNDDNNNATSTSATSLEESTDNANSTQRMKITDPQQTASDLKKLMSLILKSDGNRNGGSGAASSISSISGGDGKSGTQVVNIVITPNQQDESSSTPNHPQLKNSPQKILFLKTPQVKQMLDIALTDPALSTAAKKIAAALEANPFPNPIPTKIDQTYNNLPSYIVNPNYDDRDQGDDIMQVIGNKNAMMGQQENNDVPSTPDGFPLSGNGFLDLHHPNLHFHQALHQMVVNGSKPSNINATTKTNIINIFVINFKEIKEGAAGASHQAAGVNQSPLRINIKPSPRPQHHIPKLPFPIKSEMIESLSQTTANPMAYLDPSLIFNNKMGLAAGSSDEDDDNEGAGMSSEKNYEPSKHFDMDRFALSNPDKINIFDLLPGDIGTVTAVQYAPGVDADSTTDTETNKNHNTNNKNVTVSHLPLTDIYEHNNSSANDMMLPATMGSYFADFLPDRSREPPGSANMKPFDNENINEHDILSILTSRRPTPMPSSSSSGTGGDHIMSSDAKLPPSLAHLEWIFNNQPPPKPQVSEDDIFKRKGETTTDGDTGNNSDSMMEPDETSNSPIYHGSTTQELIEYLLKLQNVSHLPVDSNGISENTTASIDAQLNNSTLQPPFMMTNMTNSGDQINHVQHNLGDGKSTKINGTISSSMYGNDNGPIVEYTTKSPAFWKFGNKLPLGSFSSSNANNDEALNNRLRKLLTAFGFSALPTLAAGAAATWPYWVPLVATGRRRRRRRSAISALSKIQDEDSEIPEIIKRKGQQFLSNLMAMAHTTNNRNSTSNSPPPPVHGPSNRQLLSKSTKNSRGDGVNGEQKWIKVDVITATTAHPQPSLSTLSPSSSSPTSLNFEKMNGHSHHDMNETSFHSQSHNNSLPLNTKNNSYNNSSSLQKHDHQSNTTAMNHVTHHHHHYHRQDDQNDYAKLKHHPHPHEKNDRISLAAQQLDVPLLKNFLKNVLYNELTLTNMNMNTPSPLVFSSSSSSPSLLSGNKAQKLRRPPPPTRLPFLSASSSTPSLYPFSSSSTSLRPPLSEPVPVVLSQYPFSTSSTLNKIITKNGHHTFTNSQQQQTEDNNKSNNGAILLNTPFSRPSSTPLPSPSSLLLFPEYNNKGEDNSVKEQHHLIAGSDKKVVSISKFSTPSPTSVYIHNRGDGTTSVMSTQAPSPVSLTHLQNNNSPWGSSFGGSGTLSASSIAHLTPDKISSSSSSATTTFATNTAAVTTGHNDDDSLHHFSLSPGQLYDNANNQHNINADYFLNHFHQSNKRLQKIKLADSIKASERAYTSAALLPLWFPIFFGNHTQLSSKYKQAMRNKMQSHSESF